MLDLNSDTIAAITTPLGLGAVGIVKISGNKAFEIAKKILKKDNLEPNKISHNWIVDENNSLVDEVIVLPFKSPRSYTGEDVVEIQAHGGVYNLKNILNLALKNGCRAADKGEFTKRAFLNGKMDLSQVESVLDIIEAKSSDFAQKSAANLSGALSLEVKNIKEKLLNILGKITASVDFPEDVAEVEYDFLEKEIKSAIKQIDNILKSASDSNLMRQGATVALTGKVNVGKSSLFNCLLNLERAIVTDIAGTTRDTLNESFNLNGIFVTLSDTAGIRNENNIDKVEKIGIDLSKQKIEEADAILFLVDSTQELSDEDLQIYDAIKHKNHILLFTKCDFENDLLFDENIFQYTKVKLYISTKTNKNIESLKEKLHGLLCEKYDFQDSDFVTNLRQQDCLEKAKHSLLLSLDAVIKFELQDLISIDIKDAIVHLSEVTGEVVTDEVLTHIFENFCIGK